MKSRDAAGYTIERVRFADAEGAIRAIRTTVYIEEQQVPAALEWDGLDDACLHVLARDAAGEPVATARLLDDGRLGRMAVYRSWRGRGVGTALLEELLTVARERGLAEVWLTAQTRAIGFYERLGFRAHGPEFPDAGIPHRRMTRPM